MYYCVLTGMLTVVLSSVAVSADYLCTGGNEVPVPSLTQCVKCPQNSSASDQLCICDNGFASIVYPDSGFATCTDCASRRHAVSSLRSANKSEYCIPCGGDRRLSCLTDSTFDVATKRCVCPAGSTLVEQVGSIKLSSQMCASYRDPDSCLDCSYPYTASADGTCVCSYGFTTGIGGACVPAEGFGLMKAAADRKLSDFFLENIDNSGRRGISISLKYIDNDAIAAASQCKLHDLNACNYLANMCVVMQYNVESVPCALYLELVKSDCGGRWCEQPPRLPWLYYTRSSVDILMTADLPKVEAEQQLLFIVSSYHLNGTWKGYSSLLGQFNLCRLPNPSAQKFFLAGGTRRKLCQQDWRWFLTTEPGLFHELFIVRPDNSRELLPVPMIIDYSNYHLNLVNIQDPWLIRPAASVSAVPVEDGYRRRFYAYDVFDKTQTGGPTAVSTIWSASVLISTKNTQESELMVPLLVFQYATHLYTEEELSDVDKYFLSINQQPLSDSTANTLGVQTMSFFLPSSDRLSVALMVVLIIMTALPFISAVIRTYGWMRRRQSLIVDVSALVRFVVYFCSHVSNTYAFALSVASWYTFICFKSQHWLYVALRDDEVYLNAMLYVAAVTKGVHVLYCLVEQCNADYFVIDWERSKGQLLRENKVVPVSMWRSTFLANELNELQTIRYWRPLLTMTIVALFIVGLGYENMGAAIPHATRHFEENARQFTCLRIAISTFLWFAVSFVLYLVEYQIYYRFIVVHPLQAFVDLCSVSNISVIVLLESQFGFYIHGESIHAHSDVSMQEFQHNLHLESQGNLPVRGLGGQSKSQTFEVYLGPYTRQYLYICYTEMLLEHQRTLGKALRPVNPARWHYFDFVMGFGRKMQVYSQATLAIKDRINHAFQESIRLAEGTLLVKFVLQKWFDFPPNVMYMNGPQSGEKVTRDLFFFDDVLSYGRAFMCGLDFDLLILYTVLYTSIDSSLHNVYAAMVLTYVVELLLSWYRSREGLSNITQKTLIDDRFFI